jgi:hypothetical protein
LSRLGRIARVPATVQSSSRTFDKHGTLATAATNLAVITGFRLGVSPDRLAQWRSGIADRSM